MKKILLIDDRKDLLEENKTLLAERGYNVIAAESGKKGWELFKKEKPDAVILDLMMEEYDTGFILSYKIKNDDYGKNIPVILLSSAAYLTGLKFEAKTSDEKEWLKCDEIINKPVTIDDLIQKLEEHFALRKN